MRELGLNAYRFSIAWPRVQPLGRGAVNAAGLDFYDRLVDGLLEAGLSPVRDALPLGPAAGAAGPRRLGLARHRLGLRRLRRGRRRCGSATGCKHWVTHNEPWCVATLGHEQGAPRPRAARTRRWRCAPPTTCCSPTAGRCRCCARNAPGAEVGHRPDLPRRSSRPPAARPTATRPAGSTASSTAGTSTRSSAAATRPTPSPTACAAATCRRAARPSCSPATSQPSRRPLDFLGVNYYSRSVVLAAPGPAGEPAPRTVPVAAGRGAHRHGLGGLPAGARATLLRRIAPRVRARRRIYVTENGAAYADGPDGDGRVRDDAAHATTCAGHLRALRRRHRRRRPAGAATSPGRCSTTSSGPTATPSASAWSTSTTPRSAAP